MKNQIHRTGDTARPATILCIVLIISSVMMSAGCTSASTSQSTRDWNDWASLQQKFSRQAGETLDSLDKHHSFLNAAITGGDADFSFLRANLASDRESLDLWKLSLTGLDASASRFYTNASLLNGTAYDTAQRMNKNIDVYLLNMEAARGELVSYCTNLEAYLAEGDFDYADDSCRTAAEEARERAIISLNHADDALTALDTDAKALSRAQSVI